MDASTIKDSKSITFTVDDLKMNNSQIISYTYGVTFDEDNFDASTTLLTNKNRVQFTLPMKAVYYYGEGNEPGRNSAIIAYAAIKYADDWILSENHAEFIAPAPNAQQWSGTPEVNPLVNGSLEKPLTAVIQTVNDE